MIRKMMPALMLLELTTVPAVAQSRQIWSASWAASPTPPLDSAPNVPAASLARAFTNQTVDQVVRLSVGGTGLRLRLTNEYGKAPLKIGAAHVALVDQNGSVVVGTDRTVLFGGKGDVIVPTGAPWVSDPVALTVPKLARLRISLFVPENTGLCTCHPLGGETAVISPPGNFAGRSFKPVATFAARAFVSEVDVSGPTAKSVVVAFGDSITDGYRSTQDQDARWPDRLAARFASNPGMADHAVVNAGISGNRVLVDGAIVLAGQSAVGRFDRDVLSVPGARFVIVLEGVNDIGHQENVPVTAAMLIDGYRQIISRAHAKGIKVIGGTLLPYEGAAYYRPAGELIRSALNKWIMTSGEFDGTIDFDRAVRDPLQPHRMRKELQSGDWLHPNDAGYLAMGNAVSLAMFR